MASRSGAKNAQNAKNENKGPSRGVLGRTSVVALVGAFLLIVGGFVASAIFGESQESKIDDEVRGIETNSLPSVEHLNAAGGALRHSKAKPTSTWRRLR